MLNKDFELNFTGNEISLKMSDLEIIYKGKMTKRPPKVLNPDSNIDYGGFVYKIIDSERKNNFVFHDFVDTDRRTSETKDVTITFDLPDIYSINPKNKYDGRFSFQFQDMKISSKPNYRRILFFYSNDTNVKSINDYFKEGQTIEFGTYKMKCFLDEEGLPQGFAYIYDKSNRYYYFANFKDGKLLGLVFKFTSKNNKYVFVDAIVYFDDYRTNLLKDTLERIDEYNNKYDLTVISWS